MSSSKFISIASQSPFERLFSNVDITLKLFREQHFCVDFMQHKNLKFLKLSYKSVNQLIDFIFYELYQFGLDRPTTENICERIIKRINSVINFKHKTHYLPNLDIHINILDFCRDFLEDHNIYIQNDKVYKYKMLPIKKGRLMNYMTQNIYEYLSIEEEENYEEEEYEFSFFWEKLKKVRVRYVKQKERSYNYGNLNYDVQLPYAEVVVERDNTLLTRLREMLSLFSLFRRPDQYWRRHHINLSFKKKKFYQLLYELRQINEVGIEMKEYNPEMDAHGEGTVEQEQKSNVILTQDRVEDTDITAPVDKSNWTSLCSSDIIVNYNEIVDRWIQIDTFDWNKDKTANTLLKEYILPYHIIKNEPVNPCRMANCVPFTIHRYWRGDMEVKIQVNSNKFQIGSLQCSWLYVPDFDDAIDRRLSIYNLSQTHHVIINASSSNEVSLMIPFKYYLPFLHTKPRRDMPRPLALGKLYIYVLNPLTTSEGGPTDATVTVFARAFNNEFTGMLAGSIDPIEEYAPEMDAMIDVIGGLASKYMDNNRDNPPNVRPPAMLVPTASHSWSVGTGLGEPLHPLRLDGRGQVPHPPGIDMSDEMKISYIGRVFGLIKTVEWTKEHNKGKIIWGCDVAPLMSKTQYHYIRPTGDKRLLEYSLPPIAVLSSLFMSWRGTLEYKFDIVASQFHTGRLMLAYVPGARGDSRITFEQLRAGPNMVFTLQESQSFTFKVPYIANKPMWPRTYAGDYASQDAIAPSRLYMCVVNKLIPMQSVVGKVYINIYVRAGEDFELLVPVQPALGLAANNEFVTKRDTDTIIQAVHGYENYYSGSFEDLVYLQCFRWGTLSHEIAHFTDQNVYDTTTHQYSYAKLEDSDNNNAPTYYHGDDNKFYEIKYALFIYLDQLQYIIGVPARDLASIRQLAQGIFIVKAPLNDKVFEKYGISNSWSTTQNKRANGNPKWTIVKEVLPKKYWPQMGDRKENEQVLSIGTTISCSGGLRLYGENFNDLKDLTRRYQYYGHFVISDFTSDKQETVRIKFPILPQGLKLNIGTSKHINHISNRTRDGHVPLIASGFRYYRGGVRFRIVINPKFDAMVFVQHRPDRILKSAAIQGDDTVMSGEAVVNHTYASYLQLTSVNGVVEFEVPFYLLGMYGLLQQPKITYTEESNYFSLGELCLGVVVDSSRIKTLKNCLVSIYYSMADDMRFTTFQGFPRMVFLSDIPSDNMLQGKDISEFVMVKKYEPEMFSMTSLFNFNGVEERLGEIASNVVDDMSDKIAEKTSQANEKLRSLVETFDISYKDSVLKIGLEVLHMVMEPTIKTLALSTLKILLELKVVIINSISEVVRIISNLLQVWTSKVSKKPTTETTNVRTFEYESMLDTFNAKDWISFVGVIFSGICAFTGFNNIKPPKDMSRFAMFISTTLPSAAKSGTFIISFLTSVIDLVKRIFRFIIIQVYPTESLFFDLDSELPLIQEWVKEVLYITRKDPENEIDENGYFYDRVYMCYLYGQQILTKYSKDDTDKFHKILRLVDKIEQYYNRMTMLGKHPFERKEPYCIWVSGTPGLGKSHMMHNLTSIMLRHVNWRGKGPKTFTIMPAGEFWTGCKNQPVLNMDDAFSVEMGTTLERQLNILYEVKSPVALNPPMADLADKHLRYNPEIFYINSNKAFLNITGLDPAAIHRRRDVLIHAQWSDPARTHLSEYTSVELDNYSHLVFYIAEDPRNPETKWCGPFNYEQLYTYVRQDFLLYKQREEINYARRIMDNYSLKDERLSDDDIHNIHTLREIVAARHQDDLTRFKKARESSLAFKLRAFKSSIAEGMFNINWKSKYLGPLFSTEEGTLDPEMFKPELMGDSTRMHKFNSSDLPPSIFGTVESTAEEHQLDPILEESMNNILKRSMKLDAQVKLLDALGPMLEHGIDETNEEDIKMAKEMERCKQELEKLLNPAALIGAAAREIAAASTSQTLEDEEHNRFIARLKALGERVPPPIKPRSRVSQTPPPVAPRIKKTSEIKSQTARIPEKKIVPIPKKDDMTVLAQRDLGDERLGKLYNVCKIGNLTIGVQSFDDVEQMHIYLQMKTKTILPQLPLVLLNTVGSLDISPMPQGHLNTYVRLVNKLLAMWLPLLSKKEPTLIITKDDCENMLRLTELIEPRNLKYLSPNDGKIALDLATVDYVWDQLNKQRVSIQLLNAALYNVKKYKKMIGFQYWKTLNPTISLAMYCYVIDILDTIDKIYPDEKKFIYKRADLFFKSFGTTKFLDRFEFDKKKCQHHLVNKYNFEGKTFQNEDGSIVLPDKTFCSMDCILQCHYFQYYWHMWQAHSNALLRHYYYICHYDKLPFFLCDAKAAELRDIYDASYFTGLATLCKHWFTNVLPPMLWSWFKMILKICAFILTAFVMYSGIMWFFPNASKGLDECVGESTIWASARLHGLRPNKQIIEIHETKDVEVPAIPALGDYLVHEGAYKVPTKVVKKNTVKFSTVKAPNMSQERISVLQKVIRNSFFIVSEYYDSKGTMIVNRGRCLGLEHNRALVIRHYHDQFMDCPVDTRYYIETYSEGKQSTRLEVDYRNLKTDAFECLEPGFGTNFFILYMPPQFPPFKKIIQYIASKKDHEYAGRMGVLYEYGRSIREGLTFSCHPAFKIAQRGAMESVVCMSGYAYNYHGYGVCGSVLLSDTIKKSPIIGMHVAGGDNVGISEPLYREMFEQLPSQIIQDYEEPSDLTDLEPTISLETNVYEIGVVGPEMAHVETGKTAISKSEIYGVFPVRTEPAPLKPSDPRLPPNSSPLKLGCENHGKPVRPLKYLDKVEKDVMNMLLTNVVPVSTIVKPWSLQDSVCGNSNIPHCEPLSWTTSPGYGFRHLSKESGKKWLFTLDLEEGDRYRLRGVHPELGRVMKHKEELRRQGIVPYTVFVDCLKDDTIPSEKCRIPGKTRVFSISPVDFTIQFKMYFGEFLAAYTKSRLCARHAIGINPDSPEWTDLAIKLQSRGDQVANIDFKNYGPGLPLDAAYLAFKLIIRWYEYHGAGSAYIRILWCMAHEILNAYHLCLNNVYRVCSGIPSGSPITAPLNSLVHTILIRVAWCALTEDIVELHTMEDFNSHVFDVVYGDDGIYNISPEALPIFNETTICKAFADFGIIATSARKDGTQQISCSLLEASFLSRDFVLHPTRPGIYLPGLKKISIEGTANWVRPKSMGLRMASLINSRMAVELAYGWGPEYYEEIYQKLRKEWAFRKEELIVKSWKDRDKEIFDMKIYTLKIPLPYLN